MRTPLAGKTIYMSSVTDPYQPIERRLGLVRELLAELAGSGARLVVQTRSPLVARDIELLRVLRCRPSQYDRDDGLRHRAQGVRAALPR
jgi:DNA repair photolyase